MTAFEIAQPHAAALIESLRSVGYSPQTAIADIIDNSIAAGARNVWITFDWEGPDSRIIIRDDGCGMTEAELSQAMRPGSRNPKASRSVEDLGRFGLGLKTASFSQCRRLTMATRKEGSPLAIRRWDLDHVARTEEWQLLIGAAQGSEALLQAHLVEAAGTVVLWEVLDRIAGDFEHASKGDHDRFLSVATAIEHHLSMVFHRFLEGARPGLKIYINGTSDRHRVKPWDPFLTAHLATISSPIETIRWGDARITLQGYVLPHKDRLSEAEFLAAAGPEGWNSQQGIYIYRNQRILVAGSWLELGFTREEQFKLARIRVDIPNSLDEEWDIDVKKSRARPPLRLRNRLHTLATHIRNQARAVYVHRGSYGKRAETKPLVRVWKPVTLKDRVAYRIDREHPVVQEALNAPEPYRQAILNLMALLQETLPVQQIWLDTAERPEVHSRPFETEPPAELEKVLLASYKAYRRQGVSHASAISHLKRLEPFNEFPGLIDAITEQEGFD